MRTRTNAGGTPLFSFIFESFFSNCLQEESVPYWLINRIVTVDTKIMAAVENRVLILHCFITSV